MCVRIEPFELLHPIKIVIDRSRKHHEQQDAIDDAWQALCAHNPRYFNGPILVFDSFDPDSGVIHASIEEYKNHAVRDTVDVGISLLSVTAMLYADGDQHMVYLLGQRSHDLHRYGGLWELGPSGGVDVPRFRKTLGMKKIMKEIEREVAEEVDIQLSKSPYHPIALVHDDEVGSTDIAIQLLIGQAPKLTINWEYTQTRWMTLEELYQSTLSNPEEFIPTTIALADREHKKWVDLGYSDL